MIERSRLCRRLNRVALLFLAGIIAAVNDGVPSSMSVAAACQEGFASGTGLFASRVAAGLVIHLQPGEPPGNGSAPAGETDAADADMSDEEEEPDLKLLQDMPLRTVAEFLTLPAVDWIVLKDDKVLVVEPLALRPGTVEKTVQAVNQFNTANPLPKDPEKEDPHLAERLAKYYITVVVVPPLREGERESAANAADETDEDSETDNRFRIHIREIKDVLHAEDLMLRRVEQCLAAEDFAGAQDLLAEVRRRDSNWRGLSNWEDQCTFRQAVSHSARGLDEDALGMFEQLLARNPKFEGIQSPYSAIIQRQVAAANGRNDFRRVRFFLSRLRSKYPGSVVLAELTAQQIAAATAALQSAVAEENSGRLSEAMTLADRAASIWPQLNELRSVYPRIGNRYPRLKVGVVDRPVIAGEPFPGRAADERLRELTTVRLFNAVKIEDLAVRYRSRILDEWEPTELGRELRLQIRSQRQPWESLPIVSAVELTGLLAGRMTPGHPGYDDRFASAVSQVAVRGSDEVMMRVANVPLRPEAVLAAIKLDYGRLSGSPAVSTPVDNETPGSEATRLNTSAGYPFQLRDVSNDRNTVFVRTLPQSAPRATFQVAEVVEHVYPSRAAAVQGLLRGEVQLLTDAEIWRIPDFRQRSEFQVVPLAVPRTHVLQFNPKSPLLANRSLRRGLAASIHTAKHLDELYQHGIAKAEARRTSAPFFTQSYAYDPKTAVTEYNPSVAVSMFAAAKKELKLAGFPMLRLECSDDPAEVAAAERIIGDWQRVGIQSQRVGDGRSALADDAWDVRYVSVSLVEPLTQLWPFLVQSSKTDFDSLARIPESLRSGLLALDTVGDWRTARQQLHQLHRQMRAEAIVIPLWEVDRFLVIRKTVRGFPEIPMTDYDSMERWTVDPWFPKE